MGCVIIAYVYAQVTTYFGQNLLKHGRGVAEHVRIKLQGFTVCIESQ